MINIVLICDEKYIIPTKVTINSIIQNKKKEEKICIYVIAVGLLFSDLESIMQLQEEWVDIKVIIPDSFFDNIFIKHPHVSKAALYKFLIPELIDVEKILYLDSDMLALDDLESLYNTELNHMYAAVVRDIIAECHFHFHHRHNIAYYFNSGMMLLNLKALREQQIAQKLIAVRENDSSNLFMDQDTFNKVFNNKVILVSPKYNYMQTSNFYSLDEISAFYNLDKSEMSEIAKHPVILHLTDKKKPWNSCEADNQSIWYQYAFTADFPSIIQDIVRPWKMEIHNQKFKLEQQQENISYYKNNRQFMINEVQLSGVMKEIWEARKELSCYLAEWMNNEKYKIMIYGAGKMGQAVFKCLWFLNEVRQVTGFLVGDKEDNVDELYGKKVFGLEKLEEMESANVVIIVAVKNISEDEMRREIGGRSCHNIFHISRIYQ